MKAPDLFISHSSSDKAAAEELVVELEKGGLTCWLASRDVPLGGSYQVEIVNAIEHCRALLLVFSDASNRSEHVLREVELAAQAKKPIYPLRIDRSEPVGGLKYMLANKQWVERKALGSRLTETIVRLVIGTEAEPIEAVATASPEPARSSRSVMAAGAGLVVIGLVAGGGWLASQDKLPWSATRTASTVEPEPVTVIPAPGDVRQPPADPQPPPPPPPTGASVPPSPAGPIILASAPADASRLGTGVHLFRECETCPVMAVVPAGQAAVGSPDSESGHNPSEAPVQAIAIRQPFAVGRSEVSFEEWLACVAEGGCNAYRPGDYGWGYGKQPVINVSWRDAKAYVEWLSRKTGASYRLLSESEWEYAARGCTGRCSSAPFWFGTEIEPERANYDWRYSYASSRKAQPPKHTVAIDGSSAPNPFGLMHMHGNVSEWVEDCWNPNLVGLPKDGSPRTTGDCNSRVVRGGSWSDEPKDLRSAKRGWEVVGERRAQIGFRVARSLEAQ